MSKVVPEFVRILGQSMAIPDIYEFLREEETGEKKLSGLEPTT